MGKSGKTGKARQDKFYSLAKETGYRSRASFKLLQLNRKFEFLERSKVVLDLCAAPGGWLQVAANCCPVSSLIIGFDLVPIAPITNVSTYQENITTEACRQLIKRELQTWKADCVLHDGSPNVGQSWLQDAFQQSQLTLSALKLATEFLKKGGCFVTKIFRSKDYQNLIFVFKQLFKKVTATKPEASRNESAEIYVVCQYYLAPEKVDPRLLDSELVFKEKPDSTVVPNLLRAKTKEKVNRDGYADDAHLLFSRLSASEFICSPSYMQALAETSEIVLDEDWILNHHMTTDEIKECCRDIKVLGKSDLKALIKWRSVLGREPRRKAKAERMQIEQDGATAGEEMDTKQDDEELEILDDDGVGEAERIDRRKKKKLRKQDAKLRERKKYEMDIPGDHLEQTDDVNLFDLGKIQTSAKNAIGKSLVPEELKSASEDDFSDLDDSLEVLDVDETVDVAMEDRGGDDETKKAKKQNYLDPVELAMCSEMVSSRKRKGELIDDAHNRYTFNDTGLPEWFAEDERKHMKPMVPVSREKILEYKEREKAINARPIKKVVEAKARKKKKALRKLEKMRKQAETINDAEGITDLEKWRKIKDLYKKVNSRAKPNSTYVVAKKGAGKKVRRPAGVKGRFKVVDPRMKKDTRKEKFSKTKKTHHHRRR